MERTLGVRVLGDGRCRFRVWAPRARRVEVRLLAPRERVVPLEPEARGYHAAVVDDAGPGARYLYRLDGGLERPDPASLHQPEGVHGPSEVVDPGAFRWTAHEWRGQRLEDYIVYELHVGTFTPAGTFDAVADRLESLRALGVTALELMPVAQFPGERNWGYDGVYPFAAQNSYGGPAGLQRLVDACHRAGLAVVLDVVCNHLGPEGNHLADFGPYFTERYRTPWGAAINFDGPESDEVRRYFLENAIHWLGDLRIDALRLDALHAILDLSAYPFLAELADLVRGQAEAWGRRVHLIAESDLNDTRLVRPRASGGYGLDAQWNDDFHHALHARLTGEDRGHYADFGRLEHLSKALTDGYVYTGQYSRYRRRRHGHPSDDLPASKFVVFIQNHDQVGNRMRGERLSTLVPFDALKLAAGVVLLSPYLPLLFMGEEYAETAPFLYFTHHSDRGLAEAVRAGRREAFRAFDWPGEAPDPQDEATFLRSKPDYGRRGTARGRVMLDFYGELIRLRKTVPALAAPRKDRMEVIEPEPDRVLCVRRWKDGDETFAVYHFGEAPTSARLPLPAGRWRAVLDSADARWGGPGASLPDRVESTGELRCTLAPWSLALLRRAG